MANRRMFSRDVCESDAFLDLPATSQRLYFFLGLFADDEGFLKNPKSVLRQVSASVDDLNILIMKGFVIPFDSGVIVIKHWRLNNYLQSDRIKPTTCTQERALLQVNASREYEKIQGKNDMYTPCIQSVYSSYTQYSIDKGSIDKCRVEEAVGEYKCADAPSASAAAQPPAGELHNLIDDHKRAEQLIRRNGLPDNDPTFDAVLEDAERYGWEKLEEALAAAALSNSRQRLSVNYYRTFLNGTKKEAAHAADPYANFERF